MKMTMRVTGLEDTLAAFDRLGAAGEREARRAVAGSLQKVRTEAIKKISWGQKAGRVYERASGQNLSPTHQASAPGEAPATDTGRLVGSIQAVSRGRSGTVGSRLPYAFWLEHGTHAMDARPWLLPTLNENLDWIENFFQQRLDAAAREFDK